MLTVWLRHRGWLIEIITEAVNHQWRCREIRISHGALLPTPIPLRLHGMFADVMGAVSAAEVLAGQWIDEYDESG